MKYICAIRPNIKIMKAQSGNMLMMSIFAIVVLSALGVSMSRLISTSSSSIVYEVYGLKALNAARSGLDQKVLDVFQEQTSDSTRCDSDGSDSSLWVQQSFESVPGLENCRVVALCTVTDIDSTSYFRFESQGICEIEAEGIVVSRTLAIDGRDFQS